MPWCFFRRRNKLLWDYCDVSECPEPTGRPQRFGKIPDCMPVFPAKLILCAMRAIRRVTYGCGAYRCGTYRSNKWRPWTSAYTSWNYCSPPADNDRANRSWETHSGFPTYRSADHSWQHHPSTAAVLHVWDGSAKEARHPDYRWAQGQSRGDSLAGVLTRETKEHQPSIFAHLWRGPHRQLLGADRWTLHVSPATRPLVVWESRRWLAELQRACSLYFSESRTRTYKLWWEAWHCLQRSPQSKRWELKRLLDTRATGRLQKPRTMT